MVSDFTPVHGDELKSFRISKGLSLQEVAALIQVKSASTISAWENGQEIPGPAQVLLALLIRGEMPFTQESVPLRLRDTIWNLEMSLGTWEEINRRRIAGGFTSVTDWCAAVVLEKLGDGTKHPESPTPPNWRTGGEGKLDAGARHVAEESPPYVTGSKAAAESLAADWVAKNSPPGGAVSAIPDSGDATEEKAGASPVK